MHIRPALGLAVIILFAPATARADTVAGRDGVVSTAQMAANALLRPDGFTPDGEARLRIDESARAALAGVEKDLQLRVPLDIAEKVRLVLRPFTVLSPHARIVRAGPGGAVEPTGRPEVLLLRGEVAGQPGSRAFLSLTARGGGMGTITLAGGTRYQIETMHTNGVPDGLVVRPAGDDVPDFDEYCRVINDIGGPITGGCCGKGPGDSMTDRGPRLVNLAIDGDQRYVELFPTEQDTLDYMVQLVGAVSDIYMHELNLRLTIDFARIWPDGGEPFGADDIDGFREHWINNEELEGINLVHLFSGRRDMSYGGIAFLASACNGNGFAISGYLSGGFPDPIEYPHLGNWDINVVAHEIGHNLGVLHTHDYLPPLDGCITDGVAQRGTIMSYCHTKQGAMRNIDLSMHRFMAGLIDENNPPGDDCLVYDCNANGIDDAIDIADGRSDDADRNDIPDECEDCDGDGVLNSEEIDAGAPDVDDNGVPDACQADCDGNGVPDRQDIAEGRAFDQNGNFVPDSCEPDCDGNGTPDFIDILNGTHTDLDRDRVPDVCQDCLGNGQPDWEDVNRPHFLFVGVESATPKGPVREYHAQSGVLAYSHGESLVDGAYSLAFGDDRMLYATSFFTNRIIRIDPDTGDKSVFITTALSGVFGPSALLVDGSGDLLVAGLASNNISRYDGETGDFMGFLVTAGATPLSAPTAMTFGPAGNLYVATVNNHIERFDAETGEYLGLFIDGSGNLLSNPRGLLFLGNGELIVSNHDSGRIARFDAGGNHLGQFNDDFALPGPWAVAQGPDGNIYVSRSGAASRVIMLHPESGIYLRTFVRDDPVMESPRGLAFRPSSPDDLDGNNVPDECEDPGTPGDLNGDRAVDVLDLLILLGAWGDCPPHAGCPADLNGDETVDVFDLLVLLANWG